MSPEEMWLLLLFLFLLLILLLWFWWRWAKAQPPVIQPQGWLFEAWGQAHELFGRCGQTSQTVYTNLAIPLNVNIELLVGGDCRVSLSTTTRPNVLQVLPGTRAAVAVPLLAGETISYTCQSDESGKGCEVQMRIQRL